MAPRELINEAFAEFFGSIGLAECSEIQISEMKKAFYAGAWTILSACNAIGDDSVPEEVGALILGNAVKECEAFVMQVLNEAEVRKEEQAQP